MTVLSLVPRTTKTQVQSPPAKASALKMLSSLLGTDKPSPGPLRAVSSSAPPTKASPLQARPLFPAHAEAPESLLLPMRPLEQETLLRDLSGAVFELAADHRSRISLRLPCGTDSWELGLSRAGRDVLFTLFQGGPSAEVAFHERRVPGDVLKERLCSLCEELAAQDGDDPFGDGARIAATVARIGDCPSFAHPNAADADSEPTIVSIEPTGEVPLIIASDITLRPHKPADEPDPGVQRTDLFSLLFQGRLRLTAGIQSCELPSIFVFLAAEQLVLLAHEALVAWALRRPYNRRVLSGGAVIGVRLDDDGTAALTLGLDRRYSGERAQSWTFPALDVGALVQGVIAYGRALCRSLIRRDRSQSSNYRLYGFKARLRELSDELREATRDDSKINTAPESYRAFAAMTRERSTPDTNFGERTRLRFSPRWLTTVPGLDLRATFLCGDVIVVGTTHEIASIDRLSGEFVWSHAVPRAMSVMTPLGLCRLTPEGQLHLHDLSTGEIRWTTRLKPRVGAGASGAVINVPGLPRTLVISEGSKHLAAVDLCSGEVRWRFAARRAGTFRIKRAGKLLLVACGEPALTALDVLSGEVVWRYCDRLRFTSSVAVDNDSLFAYAGDGALVGRKGARLHHIDPWSGTIRFSVDLPTHASPIGAPMIAPETVIVSMSGRRGTSLVGFDRKTGQERFDFTASTSSASCLVVDDVAVVNSEAGELVGVDTRTGKARYRHVFSNGPEGDRPRRLEPVLRSGALFVPQNEVHVVKPRDGALLGRISADIIPDLLRVDERCDVYMAEESGHIGAFTAAPRLSVVQ